MKTFLNKSETLFKTSFLILALVLGFTSCSDDDDGDNDDDDTTEATTIPSDLLRGYEGTLTYSGTDQIVVPEGATADISGSSGNYTISFSDGVPSLTNLNFRLTNGVYITQGSPNIVIRLDEGELTVQAQVGGENWVFDGDQ